MAPGFFITKYPFYYFFLYILRNVHNARALVITPFISGATVVMAAESE